MALHVDPANTAAVEVSCCTYLLAPAPSSCWHGMACPAQPSPRYPHVLLFSLAYALSLYCMYRCLQMYRSAGYRHIMGQPEWQRVLEGRATPLVLMMRALPWKQRQRAKLRYLQAMAAAAEAEEQAAVGQ